MIYRITADYRPQNPRKPHYYVIADNAKAAKKKFEQRIPWLKVYECIEESDQSINDVNSTEYILF